MSTPVADPGLRPGVVDRLPSPVVFLLILVPLAAVGTGLRLLEHRSDVAGTVIACIGALLVAMMVTTRFIVRRQSLGGANGLAIFRVAVRTGTIPPGAVTRGWRRELYRRKLTLTFQRWFAPVVAGAFAVLGIWALASAPASDAWAEWCVLASAVGVGSAATVHVRRTLPRVRHLLTELDGGPS